MDARGNDSKLVDLNFTDFYTEDKEIALLHFGGLHPTFTGALKIAIPLLFVVGMIGYACLIATAVQPRVLGQHPVCVYLIGISACSILQLLHFGYEWIALLIKRYPISHFYCKVWPEMIEPATR